MKTIGSKMAATAITALLFLFIEIMFCMISRLAIVKNQWKVKINGPLNRGEDLSMGKFQVFFYEDCTQLFSLSSRIKFAVRKKAKRLYSQ